LAAADAEFYHARNFYYTLKGPEDAADTVFQSVENEKYEVDEYYKSKVDYAGDYKLGLPFYAFSDTRKTEQIHLGLFERALKALREGRDIEELHYYTCTSCGNTFFGDRRPANCPICGAPADKINAL
jgi:rubrerythrin